MTKLSEWQDAWNQLEAHNGHIGRLPEDEDCTSAACDCDDCAAARLVIALHDVKASHDG